MKLKDYATIDGQIVQILDIKHRRKTKNSPFYTEVKVKLVGESHTHWVNVKYIQQLDDQKAAQILYNKKAA